MDIEVEFEGSRTTFKLKERDGAVRPSVKPDKSDNSKNKIALIQQGGLKAPPKEVEIPKVASKTFREMKVNVAPFFSLSTDEFFFAVRIFEENQTLTCIRINGDLCF